MNYLRLKNRKDFEKIFRSGKRAYGKSLMILYLPARERKMAVCVGKKYGKSVQRNRIKRLLREAFRTCGGEFIAGHYLLIPKVAEQYSYEKFRRDIAAIGKKDALFEH